MDDNHNICDVHTVNIDSHWRDMYLEYYAKTVHQYREDCQSQTGDGAGSACHPQLHDFGSMTSAYFAPNTDFIPNYVRPRGLVYSYGFPLKDMDGNNRAIIALDRVSRHCFSHSELHSLQMIVPQINNLYKNFFYQRAVLDDREYQALGGYRLSPRELEVVKLLCRGISPINISKNLSITLATAHKHIANIHKKLNVSSQQELLNRFLWRSS
jgi:DNA-binding CsgD family transcriptional regulator